MTSRPAGLHPSVPAGANVLFAAAAFCFALTAQRLSHCDELGAPENLQVRIMHAKFGVHRGATYLVMQFWWDVALLRAEHTRVSSNRCTSLRRGSGLRKSIRRCLY